MARTRFEKGDRVGDWRLIRQLGEGGQSPVWEVRYTESRHSPPGAMKLCYSEERQARDRFDREIACLDKYRHQSIVNLREDGTHQDVPYFVMDRANATLEDVIYKNTAGLRLLRASPAVLLDLFRQAVAGVAFLHEHDVLHRDIKPANILLMLDPPEPMRAVISDVGIAAPLTEQGTLTRLHEVMGTPGYRAPETTVPGGHRKASDVYALGKTLEFLFTGSEPTTMGAGRCLRSDKLTSNFWDRLDELLGNACAFDPEHRYQDATQLLEQLPTPILATTGAPGSTAPAATPVALNVAERTMLAAIISRCPTPGASVSPWDLRRDAPMVRNLGEYQDSIAVHWLRESEFIEAVELEDERGNEWTALRPTRKGILWARDHEDEMEDIAAPTEPDPPHVPPGPGDDDIPF